MRRVGMKAFAGALLLALWGCSNFFADQVIFGGPTVLAGVPSSRVETLKDSDGNVTGYRYTYTIEVYAYPGSGAGAVEFLDKDGNSLGLSIVIPQSCPASSQDPCGPYTKEVIKEPTVPLPPVTATLYRTYSANGQSKVVPLPSPIVVY